MRLTLLIFLLFIFKIGFSQKLVEEYYLKRTLKQDGEQLNFLVLDEDKRGVLIYSKKKFYHWYKAQHMLKTQGGASGVLLHGDFESFYTNKQLARKGDFNRGLKNGEWLYWREDGTLIRTESWKRGQKHGWEKWYNKQGTVYQTTKHKGKVSVTENKDSIVESKNSGRTQTISIKDSDGKIVHSESKKNGKLNGVSKEYEDGKLVLTQKYKKGALVSEKAREEKTKDEDRKWWQIFKKKEKSETSEVDQERKWWQIFKRKNKGDKTEKTKKGEPSEKSKVKEKSKKEDSKGLEKPKKEKTQEKKKDEPKPKK